MYAFHEMSIEGTRNKNPLNFQAPGLLPHTMLAPVKITGLCHSLPLASYLTCAQTPIFSSQRFFLIVTIILSPSWINVSFFAISSISHTCCNISTPKNKNKNPSFDPILPSNYRPSLCLVFKRKIFRYLFFALSHTSSSPTVSSTLSNHI